MLRCAILSACFLLLFVSDRKCYEMSSNNKDVQSGTAKTFVPQSGEDDAKALLDAGNFTADPCEDFFEYACGKKNKIIPIHEPYWSPMRALTVKVHNEISEILKAGDNPKDPIPVNKARYFYAACTNKEQRERDGLKPLWNFLESFGGWPMTLQYWDAKKFDWQEATAEITRFIYQKGVLLNIENFFDTFDTTHNRIYIDQATFILSRDDLAQEDQSLIKHLPDYRNFIINSAKEIRTAMGSTATDEQIENDAETMLQFEIKLAKIATPDRYRYDFTRMRTLNRLHQLQAWTDSVNTTANYARIDWLKLLNRIYKFQSNKVIKNKDEVIIKETAYLKKLVALLNETPLRTIANYMHWKIVYELASTTNEKMREFLFEFEKVTKGSVQQTRLEEFCVNEANTYLGYAISYKYVQDFPNLSDNAKSEFEKTLENLKEAFKNLIDENNWIDPETKTIIKNKLDNTLINIGHPDWLMDKTKLETYYSALNTSRSDFFRSYQSATEVFNAQSAFNLLRKDKDRNIWVLFPHTVDVDSNVFLNSITFPDAFFQHPFYKPGRLAALNYGGIGAVIGHEITHGFDSQGSQFDTNGNFKNWWQNASSLTEFHNRANCFSDQYKNYSVSHQIPVNADMTRMEDIADSGAVRQAFRAYEIYVKKYGVEGKLPGLQNFTSEKLFFLSWANNFCGSEKYEYQKANVNTNRYSPLKLRVNGPLSNSDDFIKAFNCPTGSLMNRIDKCVLW